MANEQRLARLLVRRITGHTALQADGKRTQRALIEYRPPGGGATHTDTLAYLGQTALKCLEVGELEERLAMLEAAVRSRDLSPTSDFDLDLDVEGDPDNLKDLTP